jgi:16S rRNA (cytosine1407-C5)-methyltransferase
VKRKDPAAVLAKKRDALVSRTATALQMPVAEARRLLLMERRQSLRLNPLKAGAEDTLERLRTLGWSGSSFNWVPEGYSIDTGATEVRDSSLVADGVVYIQNAASWLPVIALDVQPGERVLDVCAAPGGKTTHLAARAAGQASIVANDNSRARLMKLQATCRRLGVENIQYTLYDAQMLVRKLDGQLFDKILLDAPCSGEGLMRLDRDKDFASWSVAHIKRLQQLQKRLLVQAWQLLKPGGTLVYSTCTMAPEENEAVIDYALRTLESVEMQELPWTEVNLPNKVAPVTVWNGRSFNPAIQHCLRLQPSRDAEAFFICLLTKNQGDS